jgi:DNA-binding NarL/FixJ family response regulator
MTKTGVTRIMVVDDHQLVRRGLGVLIAGQPDLEVVAEADGPRSAMKLFHEKKPDLVIVDLSLNDGSGLELIKDIMSQQGETKLLVCSMHDELLYAERALRAGAHGYVSKHAGTDELLAAIRRVLDGRVYLSEKMTDRMLSRTVGTTDEMQRSPIESLSDRELEVFEEIGRGVGTREIAEKLVLSPKTVETYRENIKAKLNLKNATELTCYAVQWVLERS